MLDHPFSKEIYYLEETNCLPVYNLLSEAVFTEPPLLQNKQLSSLSHLRLQPHTPFPNLYEPD